MTIDALNNAVTRLLEARRAAYGNTAEQTRINKKLTKLYDIKHIYLAQAARVEGNY